MNACRLRRVGWATALFLWAAACGGEPTGLMIVVDTNLGVPDEIDEVAITVVDPAGESRGATSDLASAGLPTTLALVHEGGPLGPFEIVAAGRRMGADVVERRARVSFVEGKRLVLRMDLLASCVGTTCGAEETCAAEGCRSIDVGRGELSEWNGAADRIDGATALSDGGPGSDAGALTDGGGADAGGLDGGSDCDPCSRASTVVAPGGRFPLTLSESARSGSCGGSGSEAVLSFELTEQSTVFATTHGASEDTVLYLVECGCGGAELACNDDADGLSTSVVQTTLTAGRYAVVVDSQSPASIALDADLYFGLPGAAGDDCGNPILAEGGANLTGATCALRGDYDPGRCVDGPADSYEAQEAVYYFVVTGPARAVGFDSCAGCTDFNISLDLVEVCASSGSTVRVACATDDCESVCGARRSLSQARLNTPVEPGLYYLFVDGKGGACGDYEIASSGL